MRALLAEARPRPEARFALVHAAPDYATNLPLADLDREENLLATMAGNHSIRNTADRSDSWCRISISGKAPSG